MSLPPSPLVSKRESLLPRSTDNANTKTVHTSEPTSLVLSLTVAGLSVSSDTVGHSSLVFASTVWGLCSSGPAVLRGLLVASAVLCSLLALVSAPLRHLPTLSS